MKQNRVHILILSTIALLLSTISSAQAVYFFTEGSDLTYYDQGIVDVGNLGESTFEHTYPPNAPQYDDKIPCSGTAYDGQTSLKFNYTSSSDGNWKVMIYRPDWSTVDVTSLDSLSFYIYTENELSNTALPLIGLRTINASGSGDTNSSLYALADYNEPVQAGEWSQITFPLSAILDDSDNTALDFSKTKAVIFSQSENDNSSRLLFLDEISAFKSIEQLPTVDVFSAAGYDSHAELTWVYPVDGLSYRIYASFDGGQTFELRTETTENYYLDFVSETGKNSTIIYRIASVLQGQESDFTEASADIHDFTDDELLDMVQYYSFRYFWEGAHQATGMALERSNGNDRTVASGATGMGLMAMIIAHEREYKPQSEIKDRILMILGFLKNCERHHGAWSHWYHADTYETQPFTPDDDGGDIVETSFVAQALIALKNYFTGSDEKSIQIREKSDLLFKEIDWNWYQQEGQNVLYWHWSPTVGFQKNMKVTGWNECLVTYLMAASSPTHGISEEVYEQGWARDGNMVNSRTFYNYPVSLSPDWGGPLFWIHYSHLGINPKGLKDQYADYWQEHVNTARIQYAYAVDNPGNFESYGSKCWGLTASDDPSGYTAHQPVSNDNGTISPTAALASMPYTPEESMRALKYFYRERGQNLFGKYGPYDAFNDEENWVQEAYIGIDQAPIVVMIENHRTGLLWNMVMQDEYVQAGLAQLGFEYPVATSAEDIRQAKSFHVYPNPANDRVTISIVDLVDNEPLLVQCFSMDGRLVLSQKVSFHQNEIYVDCSGLENGLYMMHLYNGDNSLKTKLVVQH